MNVIVTLDEKDHVMSISEAKKFCNDIVMVGNTILKVDGGEITLNKFEARDLHRQIHEQLYV